MIDAETLCTLTVLPDKADRYLGEVFVREAWEEWSEAWGADAVEAAHSHAAMLFKPDGVAARMIDPAVEFLEEHGFAPAAAVAVDLDRGTTRWLWLYRFNVASVDRIRLHDLVNTAGPGLFLILRDERRGPGDVPATVRLTDLKGPSRPERRRPDQLRSRLGVSDRLVNFIHTSDEPADLLREMAILVPPSERPLFFAAIDAADPSAWSTAKRQAEDEIPPHSFDGDAALGRIRAHAEAALADGAAGEEREHLTRVRDLASAAAAGYDSAARSLWEILRAGDSSAPRWEVVSFGSRTIDYDEPGVDSQTLGDAPPGAWREASPVAVRG